MKKTLLVVFFGVALQFFASAQEGKLVSAWNALESYKKGDGAMNLESALPYINEAVEHESTKASLKAWWYRAQIYYYISADKEISKKYPNAAMESLHCFKKMAELDNPKFKSWEDAVNLMQALSTTLFNGAVEMFTEKKYNEASKQFGSTEDINALIESKGAKPAIELKTALGNAAIAAENAGIYSDAISYYKKLNEKFPESKYYYIIYNLHKKNGNTEEARKIVDEGLVKYPSDKELLISKVNFFIVDGKSAEAIDYMKALIVQDPKNEQLYAALGQAYEQTKDETNAVAAYQNLITMNPNSFEGNYGLGALIFNKAKPITDEMNALGYSKADLAKYDELKKKRDGIFAQSKPYLEKALVIKPDNQNVITALKNIELLSK